MSRTREEFERWGSDVVNLDEREAATGGPYPVFLPTGPELFATLTEAEQVKAIGDEPARLVRDGEADLKDFVAHSHQSEQNDFITQKPVAAVEGS